MQAEKSWTQGMSLWSKAVIVDPSTSIVCRIDLGFDLALAAKVFPHE